MLFLKCIVKLKYLGPEKNKDKSQSTRPRINAGNVVPARPSTFVDAILGNLRTSDIGFIRLMVRPIYNFYISVEP